MNLETRKVLSKVLEGKYWLVGVDLGCGEGWFGELFKKHVKWLIGVDHNYGRLCVAKEFSGYDEVVLSKIQDYEICPKTEVAFCIEVIEHLPKNEGLNLLLKLRQVPSVYITTPTTFHRFSWRNHHESLWTEKELQNLGFQTQKFNYGLISYPPLKEGILAVREKNI